MKKKKKFKSLKRRVIMWLSVFTVLMMAFISFFSFFWNTGSGISLISFAMMQDAGRAALYIDGDVIEKYEKTGVKDEYYDSVTHYMNMTIEGTVYRYGFPFLNYYIIVPYEDHFVYIWDSERTGTVEPVKNPHPLGERGEYLPAFAPNMKFLSKFNKFYEDFMGYNNSVDQKTFINDVLNGHKENIFHCVKNGRELICSYAPVYNSNNEIVALVGVDYKGSALFATKMLSLVLVIIVFVLLVVMIIFMYRKLSKRITNPLKRLNSTAKDIVKNLETSESIEIGVNSNDEIGELSDSFGAMFLEVRDYIDKLSAATAEKERISAELDVATKIQASMLPCQFPAFPDRSELDIFASMAPAKEVGGDFYDFFLVDDDHLALVIADVSGKGIPAALFMMNSKTLIKSIVQSGLPPKEVFEKVNALLYETNEAKMFVTVWLGILQISTGTLSCANAGHEYPAIKRRDSKFELLKDKHSFVLAGKKKLTAKEYEIQLGEGDKIFVYTDGVAEATNSDNELYGTERMINALNSGEYGCERLLEAVRADVDKFVGDAPQFDDLTMLCLEYRGNTKGEDNV